MSISREQIFDAVRDLVGVGSMASIAYGFSMIYAPAGWIVGGALTLTFVILLSRAAG